MIAQLVLLATTPWLSRLFAPESFGHFALMLTISTIGGSIGGLCYEAAVMLPRSRRTAQALYRLAFLLSLVVPFLMVGLLAAVQHLFPRLLGQMLSADFYVYCLLGTVLTTQINILCSGHSRAGQYRPVATNKVTRTLLPAGAQIALAYLGLAAEGLMLGRVLGLLGSEALLTRKLPRGYRLRDMAKARLASMAAVRRSYKGLSVAGAAPVVGARRHHAAGGAVAGLLWPDGRGLLFLRPTLDRAARHVAGDSLTRVPMKTVRGAGAGAQAAGPRGVALYIGHRNAGGAGHRLAGAGRASSVPHHVWRALGARRRLCPDPGGLGGGTARLLPMATLTTVLRVQKMSFWVDALFSARVLVIPFLASQQASALVAVGAFCGLSVIYHLDHCCRRPDRRRCVTTAPLSSRKSKASSGQEKPMSDTRSL